MPNDAGRPEPLSSNRPVGPPDASERSQTSGALRTRRREEVYREILLRFFVLMKTAQETSTTNEDFGIAVERFMEPLADSLAAEGSLVFSQKDGYLFLNARRVHVDVDMFLAQKFLVETLVSSDLDGMLFERGVTPEEVCACVDVLFGPGQPSRLDQFAELVRQRSIRHIHPIPCAEFLADGERSAVVTSRQPPFFSKRTYFKGVFVLRYLLEGISRWCCLYPSEAKRSMQGLVEHLLQDGNATAALDLIRECDRSTFEHSVNVALLSLAVGDRMGLPRALLGDLGIAALLHDVGMIQSMGGASTKPMASFRRIVTKHGYSDMMLRAALVAYEHHRPNRTEIAVCRSLLSRIVDVVDRYEQLVRPDPVAGRRREPASALAVLRAETARHLDPDIVAVLESVVEEDGLLL